MCQDFGGVVSSVHDVNTSTFTTWFDYNGSVIFCCLLLNVRLLYVFLRVMVMEPNFCSTRVKKLIKMSLSEAGVIQFDFLLKGDSFS